MFCPNCKRYAGKGHEFCMKCGAFVPAEDSDTFRYASFDISGADRQRVATRKPDGAVRDEAAREKEGAPSRTGQYTQHKAPVTVRPVQTAPRAGMPPYTGAPVLRPLSFGQEKKATGCASVVVFCIILVAAGIIVPQIVRSSGSDETYYDETVPMSVYESIHPDGAAHDYTVDAVEISDIMIELDGTVSSFTLTPDAFASYNGKGFPGDNLKGVMLFTDGTALDVYYSGGSVYAADCELKTDTPYTMEYIRLASDDKEEYYIFFAGEQEITFTV